MTPELRDRYREYGLLLLRIGIGTMFVVVHGFPKIAGGVPTWERFGQNFGTTVGITFAPVFWGFMAAVSEFVGGLCLITGVLFRPACALMLITMIVAVLYNFRFGHGFASHPFELGLLFLSLILIGPGRLTLSRMIVAKRE